MELQAKQPSDDIPTHAGRVANSMRRSKPKELSLGFDGNNPK